MSKDLVLFYPASAREKETLQTYGLSREDLPDLIRACRASEGMELHMIMGINADGVVCSPIKNWTPDHPEAFSSLVVVPWTKIQEIKRRL
jgi:hypothetical protein